MPSPLQRYDLKSVEQELDDLADRSGAGPFSRPGWIAAWWRAFGKGRLEVLAIRRSRRLAAALPLMRRGSTLSSPTNWHTPTYSPLREDGKAIAELARALFSLGERRVTLSFISPQEGMAECREAATTAGYRLLTRTMERSPYVPLDEGWESYELRLTSKRRSNLRRLRRRLEDRGELSFEVADGSDQLERLLHEGFDLESRGWKGQSSSAIASRPETRRFYEEVARWAAERGWLRLAFLRLDGRALGFDYCIEDGSAHYLLKTGYDPDYRNLAPGVVMRHQMLERAFASGLSSYEFLGSNDSWKLEWTERLRDRRQLQAFEGSPRGLLEWGAFRFGRPAARRAIALAGR